MAKTNEELYEALCLLLDQVDYTAGACGLTEMVGACLDSKVLERVKAVKEKVRNDYLETGGGTDAQTAAAERGEHDAMIEAYDNKPENDARETTGCAPTQREKDMALLVKRLCRRLAPDDKLREDAMDYLRRANLIGSPLR